MLRTTLTLLLTAVLAAAAGWFASARFAHRPSSGGGSGERQVRFYQSPMHPWITSGKPGKCTICGMALAPVYDGESGIATGSGPNLVTLPASSAAVIGVQTSEVTRGPLQRTLRLNGAIEADESRQKIIAAYTDARIERIHVTTTGVTVAAGRPLATLYSPELLTARQEFHALATTAPDSPLVAIAREKLRRLGLLDAQIDALAKSDAVTRDTEILAPLSGTVIARSDAAYAGGYVKAGDPLFTVSDFSTLWAILDLYEPDLALLQRSEDRGQKTETRGQRPENRGKGPEDGGQRPDDRAAQPKPGLWPLASVFSPSAPGRAWTSPITYIDSNLNPVTRTARARIELQNTDAALRRGQTVQASLSLELAPDAVLVPRTAVLHTRDHPVAWVAKPGADAAYEPRALQLGRAGDDAYEVLSGLAPGERVVTEGALLIEGQAQISGSSAAAAPHAAEPHLHSSAAPSSPPSPALIQAAVEAGEALAADDLAAYKKRAASIPDLASSAAAAADLKAARVAFERFSTPFADQVRRLPAAELRTLDVKIYQCPMTPELGTGRWLQRAATTGIRNPFFGSDMLECGEEIVGKSES